MVRYGLRLLQVASPHVSWPLFLSNRLAIVASILEPLFSVWLVAPSQSFKSAVGAAYQAEFGESFARGGHFAQTFESSPTSLERGMNRAKDAVLYVDDFNPRSALKEREKQLTLAAMLIRNAGNGASRGRATANVEERADFPPGCIAVCTAEEHPVPEGGAASLANRIYVIPMTRDDVNVAVLTELQGNGEKLALAMREFVAWVAANMYRVRGELPQLRDVFLKKIRTADGLRARQPDILACMLAALSTWLTFAIEVGAIEEDARLADVGSAYRTLLAAAQEQVHTDAELAPEVVYRDTLQALLSNRTVTLAPSSQSMTNDMTSNDIGWYVGELAYLYPELADAAVSKQLRERGTQIAGTLSSARASMAKRGWILADGKNTARKAPRDVPDRPRVLHMPFSSFPGINLAALVAFRATTDDEQESETEVH